MWPSTQKIDELFKYRQTRRQSRGDKFHSLEMNSYNKGNRPIRAVVNSKTVKDILQIDLCERGEEVAKSLGGKMFSFGQKHDKKKRPQRKRSIISFEKMDEFFASSGGVKGLEERILNILIRPHECIKNGVLLADDDGYLLPHRLYTYKDYRLFTALIFNDPPDSSAQKLHEDVAGCDRDPIWNIIFPIKLKSCAKMAATEFVRDGGSNMQENQATMWDACWPHRGLGNNTNNERIFLHLVFAPYWMIIPDSSTREFHGLSTDKKYMLKKLSKKTKYMSEDDVQWQFVTEIQYGNREHHGLAQEYNNGLPLTSPVSNMQEWIDRLKRECILSKDMI